jgi:ABC-2 type transport system ATP-binding protein
MENHEVEPVLRVQNLVKVYRKTHTALRGISFSVRPSQVYALLGRNGAGKTTTLKSIMGWLRYSGEIRVLGSSVDAVRQKIAYVPEEKSLYGQHHLLQTIHLCQRMFPDFRKEAMVELAHRFEIPMKRKLGSFSLGMRSIVYTLIALSRDAEIYMLDEPGLGLDAIIRESLMELIREKLYEGKTVLYTSHIIQEVERIADWVSIIDHGKILLSVLVDDIKEQYRTFFIPFDQEPLLRTFSFRSVWKKSTHWLGISDRKDQWESLRDRPGISSEVPDLDSFFRILVRGQSNVV